VKIRLGLMVGILGLAAALMAVAGSSAKNYSVVQYTSDGELKMAPNYREWVYLTTGIGMSYGPAVQTAGRPPMFTNVFVNPAAYRTFMSSGRWQDKTMFVLEIYSSATHGSINNSGHYQDALLSLDVAVKDEAQSPPWKYYNFSPQATSAKPFGSGCNDCHSKNGAVDNTFVQFYPSLLQVAWDKGTVRKGVQPTIAVLQHEIEQHGWKAAEPLLEKVKTAEPNSDLLTEASLNMLGYQLLQSEKNADAVRVFEATAARYPKSANAYDSLADAYAASGDKQKAREATEKSLALLKEDAKIGDAQRKGLEDAAQKRLEKLGK